MAKQVAALSPRGARIGFYRTAAGAELDLVVVHRGRRLGIEIKFSSAPKPTKGFWLAIDDLGLDRAIVVAPVTRRYPLSKRAEVVPLAALRGTLGALDNSRGTAEIRSARHSRHDRCPCRAERGRSSRPCR